MLGLGIHAAVGGEGGRGGGRGPEGEGEGEGQHRQLELDLDINATVGAWRCYSRATAMCAEHVMDSLLQPYAALP